MISICIVSGRAIGSLMYGHSPCIKCRLSTWTRWTFDLVPTNIGAHANLCMLYTACFLTPRSPAGEGVYCFTSVRPSVRPSIRPSFRPSFHPSVLPSFRPSNIFFVAFFSATIDGRNLIFDHKLHIGMSYCGQRFLDPSDSYFLFADLVVFYTH